MISHFRFDIGTFSTTVFYYVLLGFFLNNFVMLNFDIKIVFMSRWMQLFTWQMSMSKRGLNDILTLNKIQSLKQKSKI